MERHRFLRAGAGAVALAAVGSIAGLALAYSYSWTGGSSGDWDGSNWTRTGCGSPCEEFPNDTGDDATICGSVEIDISTYSVDDLNVCDGDVRIGKSTGGQCQSAAYLTFDSVTISAGAGQTAKLRGGYCDGMHTN